MTTPVTLNMGDIQIPATLNDTVTAHALEQKLPFTVSIHRFENDYCGPTKDLETDPSQLQDGWTNGDIGYGDGYFSILFDGQEISGRYKGMMIIGRIDDGHLETVRQLGPALTVTIERA